MDLSLSDDQEQIRSTFAAFFAKESSVEVVRAAEPLGFSADLWRKLGDLGATSMALPEELGGGASLLEVGLVVTEAGRHLAPVPLVEAVVAGRLLAALGAEVPDDGSVLAFAPRPAGGDVATLVPGAAVAGHVVVRRGDDVLVVPSSGRRAPANLGLAPLADVPLAEGRVVASGPEAVAAHERAVDEWRALTAAALTGLGERALEIGVDYSKDRIAFGVPIATFQAVAHALADAGTAVRGAGVLATEALWAGDDEPGRFPLLAAMAFAFGARAARQASLTGLHVHGGYGFMLEYDIQLYFRRAKAWPLALGDPRRELRRVGKMVLGREVA
ncbi:MAG TPA: acyl-CoA dehydrogenase family protein [Acidimicrobiales bacterium]|nr:acyl-CoA dehydrogenase family protein [Acidimicrobiales bacterium]